ncbi:NADH dehydrogenase [ubiquinone] 1 alpha subcomplex subunit 12-like [Ochotona princeps]|uniref:NADH dehydrogenase [ubiquinone] 1 alpha subcomplex subunit 12-like n=1 Tax=Ochotona princeps TaxID=9978 RepID=UPI00271517CF|nr:NADH dehydrogenase [ubiquinone] 1 alpha subcomplex subunit 12-like [Ochotona princeps]
MFCFQKLQSRDFFLDGLQQVGCHGMLRGYLQVFFRTNGVRVGALVGEENTDKHVPGCHPWVTYFTEMNAVNMFWDEWHPRLHCMINDLPTAKPPAVQKLIWTKHKISVSGSREQYVSSSTSRKKIQQWVPPSAHYKQNP